MLATAQQGADEGRYGERSQIDQAAPNVERNDRGPLSLQLVPGASWMKFHNLGTRRTRHLAAAPSIRSAEEAVSTVAFASGRIASADRWLSAVEHGLEILGAALECLEGLDASVRTDVGETIARLLVELGGYDCVVVWRVDDFVLTPVSAAFANNAEPTGSEVTWLASNPPRVEECGLNIGALRGPDLAGTSRLGSGGPLESVLGPLSYALAAVKSASNPTTYVLHAISRERPVDQVDRDLLLTFAQLSVALINEPGASELLHRCRAWAGAVG